MSHSSDTTVPVCKNIRFWQSDGGDTAAVKGWGAYRGFVKLIDDVSDGWMDVCMYVCILNVLQLWRWRSIAERSGLLLGLLFFMS